MHRKKNHPGIDIIYNALLKNVFSKEGKVISVEIVNRENKTIRLAVAKLILANGTIESIRTLLFTNLSKSEYLGKGFMDHPCIDVGVITGTDAFKLQNQFAPRIKNSHIRRKMDRRLIGQRSDAVLRANLRSLPYRSRP